MVADGYTCTLRPIFAPKQRSRNRLQPKQGLGLNRKSGCANVHSTRRVISPGEYFLVSLFSASQSVNLLTKCASYRRFAQASPKFRQTDRDERRICVINANLSSGGKPWLILKIVIAS